MQEAHPVAGISPGEEVGGWQPGAPSRRALRTGGKVVVLSLSSLF